MRESASLKLTPSSRF